MLTWFTYANRRHDPTANKMWDAGGKQCVGHGNRCGCHIEKRMKIEKPIRNIRIFDLGLAVQTFAVVHDCAI